VRRSSLVQQGAATVIEDLKGSVVTVSAADPSTMPTSRGHAGELSRRTHDPALLGGSPPPGAPACEGPAAAAFAEAARAAAAVTEPTGALQVVLELATRTGPCDAATITSLNPDGTPATIAATNCQASKADHLQYDLAGGPSLDATLHNKIVIASDLTTENRWPSWTTQASGLGVRAIVSVNLFTGDDALGALNLYSINSRRFHRQDIDVARVLGAHASAELARCRTQQHLWRAIEARNVIGQAQGILMERYHLPPARAFEVLRRLSNSSNTKLADLARQLITTGQLPTPSLHPDSPC
jgi:hypothetical protein